ncbi:MAG: type II toxin-antitoxin system HicA family toxin [Cyclobacteriaceae bacterium]|nr:type II toxin-antitoxin system HicA family toxin [Cyclobacteriaceae bacterium]MCK5278037.1 type II toxin-antitoxin system HicA family toxin [Cyclobacteriaceae bacterium]MCK5369668.1 type II toxin-antitoxin system HicA family toxin [Cyclobacteriaceae bacterium]MCK5469148.1 type II toxin-antitoxin system HicA family toxin [Cyclobacteriaceae bacterium]MCK5700240.1 type II toxin-antitoxin system HicA family toxin [Cyclobacteriaceae bacterium]
MSRIKKLIQKLLSKPKDFTYDDLLKLLSVFGYEEIKKGKTSGSRRAFVNSSTKHIIRLHKPHPGKILKMYQINNIIDELNKEGLL